MGRAAAEKDVSFHNAAVGAFESRLEREMRDMIRAHGGKPFVVPSMREVPLSEHAEALAFGDRLRRGEIDVVVFLTGAGARGLFAALETTAPRAEWKTLFGKVRLVARGPKPARALADAGLRPDIEVGEPATWRQILIEFDKGETLQGKRVAVQEYGEPNRLFLSELVARGADVVSVPVYRPALPEYLAPLLDLVHRVVEGNMYVLLFTNATQVDHVIAVARKTGHAHDFRREAQRLVVGSVGPSCSDALRRHGLPVDVEPAKAQMSALVAETARRSRDVLHAKRAGGAEIAVLDAGVAHPGDPLHQSLFMKACRREPTPRTPIWLMRQAGRYMKEYRELRAKVSFLDLCKNADLAAEVTVDAAHRLSVDAAIIFSDLLLLVEPLGFELSYGKDQGPRIANPVRSAADVKRMRAVTVEESMAFVLDAIRKARRALRPNIPLIGFAGAPFTMASYIAEGGGSKNFVETKRLMYEDPAAWNALLQMITTATIEYVNAQVAAGAQAIQIFDSWVGALSPEDFRAHALPHTRRLLRNITPGVPAIYFGTQTTSLFPMLRDLGANVIGVDWRVELDEAWAALGDVAIQGNLDPVVLLSTESEIRARAARVLAQAGGRPGHIFNLGHGILPETPIENVLALIATVKEGKNNFS